MQRVLPATLASALTPQLDALAQQFTQPAVAKLDALSPAGSGATTDCLAPSITATFIKAAGILTISGDGGANTIDVSRNAAGALLVNDGHVPIVGGTPTVANVSQIQVLGQAGDDIITINEANGALPKANLFGGDGNDTLNGGSGADRLFGQNDNDILNGKGGNDQLFGGNGDDLLRGGAGDDQMFGEAGNDRMVWNPGEGTDLMEGGDGTDTAEVNGGNGAEAFTLTANGTRVRFDRIDPAPFSLDIGTTENLVLNMGGGNDTFSATGNLATLIRVTVDGGAGDDTILGSNGNDTLLGGDGNDFIDGQQGNDTADLGAGDDTFQWDPGDGSDIIEGGTGSDRMLFNGSNIGENIDISAVGDHVRTFRNVGNITMDTHNVESIQINALGGADNITVGDLTGTGVKAVSIDLGQNGAGDTQADTVTVVGTDKGDHVNVLGAGTSVHVEGLPAVVDIANAEGANDQLVINTLGGNDVIDASTLAAGTIKLAVDSGAGDDIIHGSQGADVLVAGDGKDFVDAGRGDDSVQLGAGDDRFVWDPGEGSDFVDGGTGFDSMLFNGSNASENIDISNNAGHVRFFRDVAAVTMDTVGLERIDFHAFDGADNVVVGDLTGTGLQQVNIDFDQAGQPSDVTQNSVTVFGSNGNDTITVSDEHDNISVGGLSAAVNIAGMDADGSDRLTVNALGGTDVIDASDLHAGLVQLTLNGGVADDLIIGSQGDDLVNGGSGNDTARMGAGDDTFVWNPGDGSDTVDGQAGNDTMLFNGANIGEDIDISANGDHVRFFRNVAAITMDTDNVERIDFNALGGADHITVGDLSGTDVTEVNLNLAAAGGVGDGAADSVTVNATSADDNIIVFGDSTSGVTVFGLPALVNIAGAEGANDTLTINGLAGNDVIDASTVQPGTIQLHLNGGDGDDIIIGSDGNDVIDGGPGDDVLFGGGGNDIISGGGGSDIIFQDFTLGADRIDVSGRGLSFDWLMAHVSDVDGSAVLDLGDGHITLTGISGASLHQEDFLV